MFLINLVVLINIPGAGSSKGANHELTNMFDVLNNNDYFGLFTNDSAAGVKASNFFGVNHELPYVLIPQMIMITLACSLMTLSSVIKQVFAFIMLVYHVYSLFIMLVNFTLDYKVVSYLSKFTHPGLCFLVNLGVGAGYSFGVNHGLPYVFDALNSNDNIGLFTNDSVAGK
ncbi:uncharacterized protein LOC111307772 isoform X3 [Durio zibethinus]|uniref:Uncharacterized protein LOC111307772 isoform X3 n=1 Tax=Durio zibethinus TaxID=66656 RepID=A0A6P6AAB5_DURZI|nr:uncharacterized protein LOC111307772 isoform X3 [Durio zibethinus]